MITDSEKKVIVHTAKKYKVSSVFLFGSSIEEETEGNDIDIGVKGIEPRMFFKFYAELVRKLSKPVDLVDLYKRTQFTELIEETGVRIYG